MSTRWIRDFESLYVLRRSPEDIENDVRTDNPHTCVIDDSVVCLTCALIDALGEDRRYEALEIAAAITDGRSVRGPT